MLLCVDEGSDRPVDWATKRTATTNCIHSNQSGGLPSWTLSINKRKRVLQSDVPRKPVPSAKTILGDRDATIHPGPG